MTFRNFVKRLIFFLIRKRMGLSTYEPFQFTNQKSNAIYFFTKDAVMKDWCGNVEESGVSVNWLLNDECQIRKVGNAYTHESEGRL